MSTITVYSCVVGSYDNIEQSLLASTPRQESEVRYVLFTDAVKGGTAKTLRRSANNSQWELLPLRWKDRRGDNRRTARWHKVNSHLVCDTPHSVWIDGSQRIKTIAVASQLVRPYLQQSIATFRHPERTCIYQEMRACIRLNKDNPNLMRNQIAKYRQEGYPPYHGLVETACVIRNNVAATQQFNEMWWQEISNHSVRDQLSFNYVAWKLSITYGVIPGCRESSGFFEFKPHK